MARIDLDDLIAFKTLAETHSFSAGARLIPISQSAFSRRIEKLEIALDAKLVERTTRRVTLTAVGRDFYRNISRIMSDLDHSVMGVKGVSDPIFNEVTVACVPSAVNYFASDVIRKFSKDYPNTRVKLVDSSSNDVLLSTARGDADFGVNFVGSLDPEVEFEPLLEEKFVVACLKDHAIARRSSVTWSEIAEFPYIGPGKESGNRLIIDQTLAAAGIKMNSLFELGESLYNEMLEAGVAKECARDILPLATPTKMYMNGTLRSWIHYIDLRTDNGTQHEHKLVAEGCKKVFEEQFPLISKAVWSDG